MLIFHNFGAVSKGKISLIIVIEIYKHVQVLQQSFQGCFQASTRRGFCFTGLDAGQNPFIFNLKSMDDNDGMRKI